MGKNVWRKSAGDVCDAIQFASQMGFLVRNSNGLWCLCLREMLRFFGGEEQPAINKDDDRIVVATPLWKEGEKRDFELTLVSIPKMPDGEEYVDRRARIDLGIYTKPCFEYSKDSAREFQVLAGSRGPLFYCPDLGGEVSAAQLMWLLSELSRAMNEHAETAFFFEAD